MLTVTLQAQAIEYESYHRFIIPADNYEEWFTPLDQTTELTLDFNNTDANSGYYPAQMSFKFGDEAWDKIIEIRSRYNDEDEVVEFFVRFDIYGEQKQKMLLPHTVKLGEHLLVDTKISKNKITFIIDGNEHKYAIKFTPELLGFMCVGCVGEMGVYF